MICFYGICEWPVPPVKRPKKPCEIQTSYAYTSDDTSITQISDDDELFFPLDNYSLPILPAHRLIEIDNVPERHSWEGDWNKYWNCIADY